ncbi:hypothetical protein I4U23_019384 [Adineta vaga]|nr:hypothetical protein I4U23_019384 [Adineta vaga]
MAKENRSSYDDDYGHENMDQQMLEIFSKFKDDPYADCIRVSRLTEVIQAFGRNPSMKDAKERIEELEEIGKFELTLDDVLQILDEPWTLINNDYEGLRQALQRFDFNHEGSIDIEYFRKAMSTLGEPLMKKELDELIRLGLNKDQKKIDIDYLLVQLLSDNA